jgi:hypothetical protein
MDPMGMQGFQSADEAEKDARAHLYGIPFCILAKDRNFGWIAPVEYAKKLLADNCMLRLIREFEE